MRQFWKIINWVLIIGTIIGILQPALFENKPASEIVTSLFHPNTSQEFMMRWLLVLLFSASVYVLIVDLLYRRQPVTVVRTLLRIRLLDDKGSRVEIHREQVLRPNRSGVTAYFSRHTPDSGSIEGSAITTSIYSSHFRTNDRIDKIWKRSEWL